MNIPQLSFIQNWDLSSFWTKIDASNILMSIIEITNLGLSLFLSETETFTKEKIS